MKSGLQTDLLAEETHSSRLWALIMLPALIVPAVSVLFYPAASARFALILVATIGFGSLALVWSGFQYRFPRDGVEVKTLGFQLRWIPRQTIMTYSIEPWSLMRGYGIRAMGSTRAYVWGNKVVHIQTTNGEIYLGHDNPEKLVHDLDQVTGSARSR